MVDSEWGVVCRAHVFYYRALKQNKTHNPLQSDSQCFSYEAKNKTFVNDLKNFNPKMARHKRGMTLSNYMHPFINGYRRVRKHIYYFVGYNLLVFYYQMNVGLCYILS